MFSHNSNTYIKLSFLALTFNNSTLLIMSNLWDTNVNLYDTTISLDNEGNAEFIRNRKEWSKYKKCNSAVFHYTCESTKQACVLATVIFLSRFQSSNFEVSHWNYAGTIYQWNDDEKKLNEKFNYQEFDEVVKATYSVPLRNLLYSNDEYRNDPSLQNPMTNVTITEDNENNELKSLLSKGTIAHGE